MTLEEGHGSREPPKMDDRGRSAPSSSASMQRSDDGDAKTESNSADYIVILEDNVLSAFGS